jgi:hypothetical protein
MAAPARRTAIPTWPLPALCALLPLGATAVAWTLSVQGGWIDACNPFWDGCTSISRAARHGLGNHVFRALVLPAAALQVLFWLLCSRWLAAGGRGGGVAVPLLGLAAGAALALYATFLGTDGEVYRTLRRYGVTIYFACTYLALLLALRRLARAPGDWAAPALQAIALIMLMLGVASTMVAAAGVGEDLRDRIGNALEWQLGVWLTAMFGVFAWRWREFALLLQPASPPPAQQRGAARGPRHGVPRLRISP